MTISINRVSKFMVSVMAAAMFGVLLAAGTANAAGLQLGRDLYLGSNGADVRSLQQFLNGSGYTVATTGVGAPGYETMIFGNLTRAALIRFQAANGLAQTGAADSATRTAMANWGGTVTGVTGGNNNSTIQAMIETLKVRIAELQKQLAAILAGSGTSTGKGPGITALKVADGGDSGVIDAKDTITITFNEAIDPESINDSLDNGGTATGVTSSMNGGVSVSSTGKVTIKNIASFDMGSVADSGTFTSKLALSSSGKVLTITLTSGSDIDISSEDFGAVAQIGGKVKDTDGNVMEEDEGVTDATGTFGGESTSNEGKGENPSVDSIVVADGGNEGYIDAGDTIKITFSEPIDPESINSDLAEGNYVSGVPYSKTGGVSVSSVGRVTIKGIAAFTAGEINDSGSFTCKLALNSTGKVLTVTLTSGSEIAISDEDFMAAAQLGGVVKDKDGNKMQADPSIDDPTGTFGGTANGSGPSISSIVAYDDNSEGYIDTGDYVKITFNAEIDPTSVNADLDEGGSVSGVSYSSTGGVSVSSTGKVTIKNIASFDMGSVGKAGNFDTDLELNSTGKVLTVYLSSGSQIEITAQSFSAASQIGGYVTNADGDEMGSDSSINEPTGTFGGSDSGSGNGPISIGSITLANGGDKDYLDDGDTIKIAFSDPIDPSSISSSLDAGGYITGVAYSKVGGVSLSSSGKVTVKGIATFTFSEVDGSGNFTSKLTLNDDADELTIKITSGTAVEITDSDFGADTTQVGSYITNEDGDKMESDSSISDPDGNF